MAQPPHQPLRRCVTCGERSPKRGLLRLVRTPVGQVQVDPGGKVAGRGAYVCRTWSCWDKALQRPERLERALRQPLPPEERERLAQALKPLLGE